MKLTANRDDILGPLQTVIGVVERRQTMPVLANVLLAARDERLSIAGTDLEVELMTTSSANIQVGGEITVPGRKFLDILKALPANSEILLTAEGDRVSLKAGRSRFTLSVLPAVDFPRLDHIDLEETTICVGQCELRRLIELTGFAMAQQDVRYFLNGLLLETEGTTLRAVATDGHRLAMCEMRLSNPMNGSKQVIVPRKGVLELQRVLTRSGDVELTAGANHIRARTDSVRFASKLIDGRFPDYRRVLPAKSTRVFTADLEALRQALQRTAILSNATYRGIRLILKPGILTLQSHNPEQDEAEDEIEVTFAGEELEIGFNVNYLLDALGGIDGEQVEIGLTDASNSCLIRPVGGTGVQYVISPMRL